MTLNDYLSDVGQKMKNNGFALKEYIITKQLTRATTDYSDSRSLPHVQIAMRLKKTGKSESELVGSYIPYVICKGEATTYADRAFSPDEVMASSKVYFLINRGRKSIRH